MLPKGGLVFLLLASVQVAADPNAEAPSSEAEKAAPPEWISGVNGPVLANPCLPQVPGATAEPNPCAPITTTPAPTEPPTMMVPLVEERPPPLKQLRVCVDKMDIPPGGFTPWWVYKYVKINSPFINTPPKMLENSQFMSILNTEKPIQASSFSCVKEDQEWKARITAAGLQQQLLALEFDNNWGAPLMDAENKFTGRREQNVVFRCAMQDLVLYRGRLGELGLRADYGQCQTLDDKDGTTWRISERKAFMMIGLRKVTSPVDMTANVGGFFKAVCEPQTSTDITSQFLDLTKTISVSYTGTGEKFSKCPISSASIERFQSLIEPPCFPDTLAITLLGDSNEFPTIEVTEADYEYLMAHLPVRPNHVKEYELDGPVAMKTYGKVTVDRVSLLMPGMTCDNTGFSGNCNTIPLSADITTTTQPPCICIDCELHETIYAIVGTWFAVIMFWATGEAFEAPISQAWKSDHHEKKETKDKTIKEKEAKQATQVDHEKEEGHEHAEDKHAAGPWFPLCGVEPNGRNIFWIVFYCLLAGFCTVASYFFVHLVDWSICVFMGWEICIKLFPFEFDWIWIDNMALWLTHVKGNYPDSLTRWDRGGWITRLDPWICVDVCYFRLLAIMLITWVCLWLMFLFWRFDRKEHSKVVTSTEETVGEGHALMSIANPTAAAAANGGGGGTLDRTADTGFFTMLFTPAWHRHSPYGR